MLLAALLMTGCATTTGTVFPIEKTSQIQPGKTSRDQVKTLLGTPFQTGTYTASNDITGKKLAAPRIIETMTYRYEINGAAEASPEGLGNRWATIHIYNDIVLNFRSGSSFRSDSSDFDATKVNSIKKGQTTEKEIVELFGPARGRGIYPAAASLNGRGLFYDVFLRNTPAGQNTSKTLSIFVNEAGVVEDFRVSVDSKAIPIAPTPVTIPIYLPR